MAKSERQTRSLKSQELFFDSEASLLDQQDFDMSSCPFNDVFNSEDSHMEQINTFLRNVQVLLEAARFLESADRKDGSEFGFFLSSFCAVLRLMNTHSQEETQTHAHARTHKTSLSTDSDNKGAEFIQLKHRSLARVCTRLSRVMLPPPHFTGERGEMLLSLFLLGFVLKAA